MTAKQRASPYLHAWKSFSKQPEEEIKPKPGRWLDPSVCQDPFELEEPTQDGK